MERGRAKSIQHESASLIGFGPEVRSNERRHGPLRLRSRAFALLFAASLLSLTACNCGEETEQPKAQAFALEMVSGDWQVADVGEELPEELVVRVVDEAGAGVEAHVVLFTIAEAPGGAKGQSLSWAATLTGEGGLAIVRLTMGSEPGDYVVSATAAGDLAGSPVVFTASAEGEEPGLLEMISGDDQTGVVTSTLAEPLVVRLVDEEENPVFGAEIAFGIHSAPSKAVGQALGAETVTTGEDGSASTTLSLGSKIGIYEVRATVVGDPAAGQVRFEARAIAGEAHALRIASGDGQAAVIEEALEDALTVRVVDEFGNAVEGHEIAFGLGHAPSGAEGQAIDTETAVTDASGLASTRLTLGSRVGTYVVDATASPALMGSPVSFVGIATADEAHSLEKVSGDGQSGAVRSELDRKLHVRVVDRRGNVVVGHEVIFAIDLVPEGSTGEILSETRVTTGPGGLAGTSLTLGTRTGEYIVHATGTGSLSDGLAVFTATATAAAPVEMQIAEGDGQTEIVTRTLPGDLVVRLLDEHGNVVPGFPVSFQVSDAPAGASGQMVSVATTTTDWMGTASTSLTLGNRPGSYQVRASAAESLEVIFTAAAIPDEGYSIERVSEESQVKTVRTAADPMVVLVRDGQGNPVTGHPVSFEIEEVPENAEDQAIGSPTVMTGADGRAEAVLTLGTKVGEYRVRAHAAGLFGSPVHFFAHGVSDAAFAIEEHSGDGQVAQVTHSLPEPLRVRVVDQFDNPVAGHGVSFVIDTVPDEATGQSIAHESAVTDEQGLTQTSLTLGTRAGTYEVHAVAASALEASPVIFNATAVGGAAVSLQRISEPDQTASVTGILDPMVVRVVDSVGNGTAGHPVSFIVQSAPGAGDHDWIDIPAETDLTGHASATLQLGTMSGSYSVRVNAGGLSGSPMDFTATALPGEATEVLVEVSQIEGVLPGQLLDLDLTVIDAHTNTVTDWTGILTVDVGTDPWAMAPVTIEIQESDQGSSSLPSSLAFSVAYDAHLVSVAGGGISGLSSPVEVVTGRLVDLRVDKETYGVLETGGASFSYALGSAWPPDGSIEIVMPEGYDLSAATLEDVSGADGTFTLSLLDNRTALIARDGASWIAEGSPMSIELGGVLNPAHGAEGLITVSTLIEDGRPVDVGGFYLRVWLKTAMGDHHGCGIDTEGRLWCWGRGRYGRLGTGQAGTTYIETLPTEVEGGHTDWIAVSGGFEYTCGIRAAGTGPGGSLWCWGRNDRYQLGRGWSSSAVPVEVSGEHTDWIEVTTGYRHTCGRRDSGDGVTGTLWCWGEGSNGRLGNDSTSHQVEPVQVAGAHEDWLAVAAGASHTCGVSGVGAQAQGTMWCWGLGSSGQVGHGSSAESHVPVEVAGWDQDWTNVSAGWTHSCGIRAAGTDEGGRLWCWGQGTNGRLGYGEAENRFIPVQVAGSHADWTGVSAGFAHTCGLRDAGTGARATAWCWGQGEYGRLGNRGFIDQLEPVAVHGGSSAWVDMTSGRSQSCGVRALGSGDGGVMECWGFNGDGRLGLGLLLENQHEPVRMDFDRQMSRIAAGQDHGCAIGADGTLWCWGRGDDFRLGNGDTHRRTTPWEVHGEHQDWFMVTAGSAHGCGVREVGSGSGKGTLWCWGHSYRGRLGNGRTGLYDWESVPAEVSGQHEDWVLAAAGSAHSCGVRAVGSSATGTLWCWGLASSGQVGDGFTSVRSVPVEVVGGHDDWRTVATGNSHSCGIREVGEGTGKGTLWCWGFNGYGQLGDDSTTNRSSPVETHGGFDDWIWVSAGQYHTCGIRAAGTLGAGTLWCWGYGSEGRLGNGGTEHRLRPTQVFGDHEDWTTISCGNSHSCGIREFGGSRELWCFGSGAHGRLGNGETSQWLMPLLVSGGHTDWLAVAAGGNQTYALRPAAAWSWGLNTNYMQLGDGTGEKAEPFRVENPILVE